MDYFVCSLSWLSRSGANASVRNKVYELKSLGIPFNAKTDRAADNRPKPIACVCVCTDPLSITSWINSKKLCL